MVSAMGGEGVGPGDRVCIVAVDKRPVDVQQNCVE
jgi:hypothetical protein